MRIVALVAAVAGIVFLFASNSHTAYAEQAQSSTEVAANSSADQTITVQSGDYLSKLATTYETSTDRLYDANTQIKNPNLIYPGEQLSVPAADEQLTPRQMPVANTQAVAPTAPETDDSSSAPQPVTQVSSSASSSATPGSSVWDSIAQCESNGNWQTNTGNGYYGGLQFTLSSWQAFGGSGNPSQASRDEQIAIAQKLQASQGWSAWPVCSARLGL